MTTFAASVTRSDLGLGVLNINDQLDYIVGSDIMGAMVSYDRQTVSSPYVNGDVTVHRRRGSVTEKFSVYVLGDTQTELQNNIRTLISAFSQNKFNLVMLLDGIEWSYVCEASDYQVEWSNANFFSIKVKVVFNLLRSPIALVGGV
jgi:hypothetical protein